MAREQFTGKLGLSKPNKERLDTINSILREYKAQGYILTLRQLYYQLVSRDVIANNVKEYAKLSQLLVKGRMAGIVDWEAIEDRGRQPKLPWWTNGIKEALDTIHDQYRLNRQKGQETYVEVWVEKDALSSIFSRVTNEYHVRLMVNKGYSSCSAMYDAYQRFVRAYKNGAKKVIILYFGDHDPSGLDMIRDIRDRISQMIVNGDNWDMIRDKKDDPDEYHGIDYNDDYEVENIDHDSFSETFEVRQIGLNMKQINKYKPPTNPAKITDPRAKWYLQEYGQKSWELDALPPKELARLTKEAIEGEIDLDKYEEIKEKEDEQKKVISKFADEHENDSEEDEEDED